MIHHTSYLALIEKIMNAFMAKGVDCIIAPDDIANSVINRYSYPDGTPYRKVAVVDLSGGGVIKDDDWNGTYQWNVNIKLLSPDQDYAIADLYERTLMLDNLHSLLIDNVAYVSCGLDVSNVQFRRIDAIYDAHVSGWEVTYNVNPGTI